MVHIRAAAAFCVSSGVNGLSEGFFCSFFLKKEEGRDGAERRNEGE